MRKEDGKYYRYIDKLYRKSNSDLNLQKMLGKVFLDVFNNPLMTEIMSNNERRIRLKSQDAMFIVTDTSYKNEGDMPHQNAHEHLFSYEVTTIEEGEAIGSTLLPKGIVKLSDYQSGDLIINKPETIHSLTLFPDTIITTLKHPYVPCDWYGSGNTINSSAAYYLDCRIKTLDLDEMNYILGKYQGIIDGRVVREFDLIKRWKTLVSSNSVANPYEILINNHNREDIRKLIELTKDNEIAAFYLMLANNDFHLAMTLYSIYQKDIDFALSNTFIGNESKPLVFAKEKGLIKQKK